MLLVTSLTAPSGPKRKLCGTKIEAFWVNGELMNLSKTLLHFHILMHQSISESVICISCYWPLFLVSVLQIIYLLSTNVQSMFSSTQPIISSTSLDGEFQDIVKANKWRIENGVIYIRGQEEHIKPKRILAKIDFDSEFTTSSVN